MVLYCIELQKAFTVRRTLGTMPSQRDPCTLLVARGYLGSIPTLFPSE